MKACFVWQTHLQHYGNLGPKVTSLEGERYIQFVCSQKSFNPRGRAENIHALYLLTRRKCVSVSHEYGKEIIHGEIIDLLNAIDLLQSLLKLASFYWAWIHQHMEEVLGVCSVAYEMACAIVDVNRILWKLSAREGIK